MHKIVSLQEIITELKKFKSRIITQEIYNELHIGFEELREKCVVSGDQEYAKLIWCYKEILEIQTTYINTYILMKKGEFYKAWCELEICEKHLNYLSDHFKLNENGDHFSLIFIQKQVKKYQEIYPNYLFHSVAMVIKKTRCNICGKANTIGNHCGHYIAEIYDGVRCVRIPIDFELDHSAIVKNPYWKYRVLFGIDEETGEEKDNYDYRVLSELTNSLNSPFIEWDYIKKKLLYPHSHFTDYKDTDNCPCGSKEKYGECCKSKEGVLITHYDFSGLNQYEEPRLLNGIEGDDNETDKNQEDKILKFKTIMMSADLFYIDY